MLNMSYDALLHPAVRLIGERDDVAIERMSGMIGIVAWCIINIGIPVGFYHTKQS